MPDATKRIRATHGPYAGQNLDVAAADADQAITDGWAIDPFAAVDPNAPPPEFNQEKHDAMLVAAQKAARKLRGEHEPGTDPNPEHGKDDEHRKDKPQPKEQRSLEAEKPAATGYETRGTTSKSKSDK